MKKIVFIFLVLLLGLVACNTKEVKEEVEQGQVTQEQTNEEAEEAAQGEQEESNIEVEEEQMAEDTEETEEQLSEELEESVEQETSTITSEQEVKDIIEYYAIGEADKLVNISFENSEIKATIDLAQDQLFSPKDIAVTRYSQLSDELLYHDGWELLTITYTNIGTISMNRTEKETNEYGDYFPTLKIEERLQ
ncbi:hypothetical protein [Metabacillus iocasae]|uniref:Uncharacterized protein HemX n=1 Tax=Priestia iocasae TaxID=2291674 RepID=A0ABS2QVH5_9BACI|nr:hypothetical protein [Metabacillus iocasae]MBM7703491.1 uncharacterized protein HemX [Metabacillus iocasae]